MLFWIKFKIKLIISFKSELPALSGDIIESNKLSFVFFSETIFWIIYDIKFFNKSNSSALEEKTLFPSVFNENKFETMLSCWSFSFIFLELATGLNPNPISKNITDTVFYSGIICLSHTT